MKIGIDAKWFFTGPPSGRVVLKNLLAGMLQQAHTEHQFYIFLNKEDEQRHFPFSGRNILLIYVRRLNNLLANVMLLPKYHKQFDLDVTLFQNFGCLSRSVKSIVYIHDLLFLDFPQYFSFKEKLYLKAIGPLARRAHSLVTISETEKARIVRHGLASEAKVHFVHHGVSSEFGPASSFTDQELDEVRSQYGLPKVYVLFLGRLNIRKNIRSLLLAMKDVDAYLVIAGGNSHKTEDLDMVIEENKLKEKVIFTGHIADGHLSKVYALATIFCFPSFAEGFGLPPLEAMASGVPVISSDRTSLKEVCGPAALYVNPDQPSEIANSINVLLNSPEKRKKQIAKGFQRANLFTWQRASNELMKIIEQV